MEHYDQYLIDAPRTELLEQLYALLINMDAFAELKESLLENTEHAPNLEMYGELSALEYSLRLIK